ncbi:hypothetical protein BN1723_017035, partial [Verticillium longisporum]
MLRSSLSKASTRVLQSSRCAAPASRRFSTLPTTPRTAATQTLAASRRPLSLTARRHYASATDNAPDPNDNFLSGNTANYIDEMYMQWKEDPKSVHVSWQVYFRNMESGDMPISQAFTPPPSLVPGATGGVPRLAAGSAEGTEVANHLKVQLLVRAYQARGHNKANIDPLGIRNEQKGFGNIKPKELTLEHYQFTEKDLDTEYSLGPGILPRFKREGREKMTLREIIDACERIYCGSYGIEFIHIPDREKCDWLRERLEVPQPFKYSIDEKRRILDRLIWSSSFESFLSTKYPNDKRFGLEGCETLVPGMKALIDRSVDYGVKDIVIGMPHRGRLNVLSNVVRKPNESIFSEFAGTAGAEDEGSGDVKYHLGMNFERPTPSGKRVQLSLGVVYECLGFHSLPAFSTGGTIHLVVNNQIGFTTDPRFARSTAYCTDIAKAIDAPVFHVNADDVEAVNFVCQMAADWRAEFQQDVIVDLVCYRKHGHNETDQPSFTQPLMYKRIQSHKSQIAIYVDKLIKDGTFTKEDVEEHKQWVWGMLEESFTKSKEYQPTSKEWTTSAWNGFKSPKELATE